jgi:hypothetical protein
MGDTSTCTGQCQHYVSCEVADIVHSPEAHAMPCRSLTCRGRYILQKALRALLLVQLATAVLYICMVAGWVAVAALLGRLEAIPFMSVVGKL